ncbi:hypothetical protein [Sphingobacterium sp. HMA12]|uniref:hypothetical protein n=1 Tax=Sphingobacterium sp. HMA12 TaxID=2050894 RepID=UPI001315189B|nr:hypothetical protein [Sphingobacterium sp. HMA12]
MKTRYTIYTFPALLLLVGILFSGCKKEYEIAPTPYTEITSFKIPYNGGKDTIVAAVDGQNIYISWPGSTEWPVPETVSPVIKIAKNASISPASGTAIILKDGAQYEVKAQDGTTKVYTIKLSNGAVLPSFLDEETINTLHVGGTYSIQLRNLATDGSDSLFLVNDQNKLFKLIAVSQIPLGSFQFIADQYDGTGIPAGDYYVQINNKYKVPVRSSKKIVNIPSGNIYPYPYFNHTKIWEVKRGDEISIPIRHLSNQTVFSGVIFNFINESGYPDAFPLEFLATSEDLKSIRVKIPNDAPTNVSTSLSGGILLNLSGDWSTFLTSPYYQYPIKVIE